MSAQSIVVESSAAVTTITLNRPAVYNAVNIGMLESLRAIIDRLERDPLRAVILTGAAPGFCSGIDLKESREATSEFVQERSTLMHDVLHRFRRLPFPTITVIDGIAAGLGCELAISGDLRIASERSRFGYPEPRVAVPSPTHHLRQLVGLARAQDMLLTARWVEGGQAVNWGLATRLADNPMDEALALVDEVLSLSPVSLSGTKENLFISMDEGGDAATRHHISQVTLAAGSRDRAEALAAFAEKRQPRFTGN